MCALSPKTNVPRIIITTQVYPPEIHPTAVMVRELAEYLVSVGWDVTVCAGYPHHPSGQLYPGWRKRLSERSCRGGVEIIRSWHLTYASRSIAARAATFISQTLGSTLTALCARRADVVLVFGPPLVGPNFGVLVALRHQAKLVTVIYDIYPDIAIEAGKVSHPLVIGAARIAERIQYLRSDRIIVLSDGFKQRLVARGVPERKVTVVPVWLDTEEIQPKERLNAWRQEQGIDAGTQVVLYAGTIGIISNARIVADVALRLRERDDVLFLFVGEGEEKAPAMRRVAELGLDNVRFLPFQPRERLSEMMSTADICLVTLARGRGLTSVPSKVQGYMAAGRPVIACVDEKSDTARELLADDAGRVVQPEDAEALASAIATALDDAAWRSSAGRRGRQALVDRYDRDKVLERFEAALSANVGETAARDEITVDGTDRAE